MCIIVPHQVCQATPDYVAAVVDDGDKQDFWASVSQSLRHGSRVVGVCCVCSGFPLKFGERVEHPAKYRQKSVSGAPVPLSTGDGTTAGSEHLIQAADSRAEIHFLPSLDGPRYLVLAVLQFQL